MKRSRDFWEQTISRFFASGKTQRVFCQEEGVALSTLQYWIYRLRQEQLTPAEAALPAGLTESRAAESGAVLRHQLGALLYDLVPCAVTVIDRDYRIIDANARFREAFGEWQGCHCYEVFKRLHRPCANCSARQTFEDGQVHVVEEQGINREGKPTYYELKTAPVFAGAGAIQYVLEMCIDTTRVRSLESQYQLLFERVPCYITVLDRDYRIVEANWRHREVFGYTLGKFCHEVYKQSSEHCPSCTVRQTFVDGRVHTQRQEALDKTGAPIHFIVHSAPLCDEAGQITRAIEMAIDITSLVEVQSKLQRARQLATMDQAMELMSGITEHILAELARQVGRLQAGAKAQDLAAVSAACSALEEQLKRIAAMHAAMVRYSAELELRPRLVDPGQLIEELATSFAPRCRAAGVDLRTELAVGLAAVPLDSTSLSEVLAILAANALEACLEQPAGPGGHQVVLRARPAVRGGVLFEVQDTGAGIEPQHQSKLFTFFSTKRRSGAGLSLVLAQKTVRCHGGRIAFRSQPGQGSCFFVEIPPRAEQARPLTD